MTQPAEQEVTVGDLIAQISSELLEAQDTRVRDQRPPVFEVSGLDITISFLVTRSKTRSAAIDLRVVRADMGRQHDEQAVQTLTLHLATPREGGQEADRPQWDVPQPIRPRLVF